MNDNYSHADSNIIYITESIPGPKENTLEYEKLFDDYNSQYSGCDCKQICLFPDCKCLQQSHGINYECFTIHGKDLLCIKPNTQTYPIYECTNECPCNQKCNNRVVQRGPIEGLIVKPCNQKGFGIITLLKIQKGSFICEYAGEVLTKTQALSRIAENETKRYDNFIFCLNEHISTEIKQTFVDPSKFGNIGRYINHSCDPNAYIVPVRCDSPIPKLAIFASKDIEPNEEITFHYGTDCRLGTKISHRKCNCNTLKCQGYLPFSNF